MLGWFQNWVRRQRAKGANWSRWQVLELRECYLAGEVCLPWSEIVEVVAFKRDLFIVDQIVLGVRRDGDPERICIEEEHPDWGVVREDLERRFGIGPEWWMEVAFPAFETRFRVLWSRPT